MSSSEAIAKARATNKAKHRIVLAPVQREAALFRSFGRPELPMRELVLQKLIGAEE